MKQIVRRLVFLWLLFLSCSTAFAADDEVHVAGPGSTSSCGAWLSDRAKKNGSMWIWALGFLSGAATFSAKLNPLKDTDADGVAYWLDAHCKANPAQRFTHALADFVNRR